MTMINSVILDNEIKIWWEYIHLEPGQCFQVERDGVECYQTTNSHYNFTSLKEKTDYTFTLKIMNGDKMVETVDSVTLTTLPAKIRIDVTQAPYYALGDGKTLNTAAIQKALNDCDSNHAVYIPAGVFLTGALTMPSNTELYLADEAVLQGTDNPSDYLPKIKSRFEGWEMMCYRSLINTGELDHTKGCTTENIVIRGGKILGGGNALRKNIIATERAYFLKLHGLENEPSPDALYASVLPGRTRGRLLCCCNTKNIIVANTVIGNAPAWNLQFIYCEDVVTCSSTIVSHKISNGDGWDPDSSTNCVIFGVEFDTGDDCVAVKSGKNPEGYYIGRPTEHVRVFDCHSAEGHGIAIGSEMSGGVEDVKIWNIKIDLGVGIYIKTREVRGGYVKDVGIYNCDVGLLQIGEYKCVDDGERAPQIATVSDIELQDLTLNGILVFTSNTDRREAEDAVSIVGGSKANPVKNLTMKNIVLKHRSMTPYQMLALKNVEHVSFENIICAGEV